MRFVLYQMETCPFCKHFRRMFFRDVPDGETVMLSGHEDPGWIEYSLDYVPTVIAYDEEGREADRLGAERLVGINRDRWEEWKDRLMKES